MKLIHILTSPLDTNTYVVINGGEAFVVDPGDGADEIMRLIRAEGAKLTAVLLTHGHADHIGAVAALQREGAHVFIHRNDFDIASSFKNMAFALGYTVEKFTPDVLLAGGETLAIAGLKVKVMHTPGHTAGGVCYIVGNKIFTGDTLFYMSYGRTDFPTGNFKELKNSIINKLFALNEDYEVFSGHGDTTTLDFERRNNPVKA